MVYELEVQMIWLQVEPATWSLSITCGGWYLDNICKYFWYLKKLDHIKNAGRAIAGFHDAHLNVFSPSLGFISNKKEEYKAFNYGISFPPRFWH